VEHEVVTVTDAAAERATALLRRAGLASGGLRVRVQSAGCEGFIAVLDLAAGPDATEIELADNGVRLFADIGSMLQLPGATLDHRRTPHGVEFVWSHPDATGVCGCAEPRDGTLGDNEGVRSTST
jgi:iron-sulfur cluster assembly accessory protein